MADQITPPSLHNVKIYMSNPDGSPTGDNLEIEIDGKKLQGIISFNYKANGTGYPILEIQMVAKLDIQTKADVNIKKIDPQQDSLSF